MSRSIGNGLILATATQKSPAVQMEGIVTFPQELWLSECATVLLCRCNTYFDVILLYRGLSSCSFLASDITRPIGVTWLIKFVRRVGEQNRLSVLGTLIQEGVKVERGGSLIWTSSFIYLHPFPPLSFNYLYLPSSTQQSKNLFLCRKDVGEEIQSEPIQSNQQVRSLFP